jgi:hypothetical protein
VADVRGHQRLAGGDVTGLQQPQHGAVLAGRGQQLTAIGQLPQAEQAGLAAEPVDEVGQAGISDFENHREAVPSGGAQPAGGIARAA